VKRGITPEIVASVGDNADARAGLEDALEAINLMERNVARAHKLVQDFKKVSVSQITDPKERFDLADAVAEIVDLFKINARQARLDVWIEDALPGVLRFWDGY